jgi:hypothetical protein
MVSLLSLVGVAAVATAVAALAAWRRGLSPRDVGTDLVRAQTTSLATVLLAVALFALSYPPGSAPVWRVAGSVVLLAAPLTVTAALRLRGRRSIPRALVASGVAVLTVVGWLTLHLKGIRGGWTCGEILVATAATTVAVASAACAGWWSKRARRRGSRVAALVLLAALLPGCDDRGVLELTILDTSSGAATPARVELRTENGEPVLPRDALAIFGDCGQPPVHNWVPFAAPVQAVWWRQREIWNPYTGTRQFYSNGSLTVKLQPGPYVLTVAKGMEYRNARTEFIVAARETRRVQVDLDRWIDLPQQGWYGADDHLHIPRPHPRFDSQIATWMQAEDIHVANLLQMGLARDVHITPQHGMGPGSVYRDANTLLLSGQENPRTHVLGHSIILGARDWIDFPPAYLLYDRFWEQARAQGAVNGYAHWGLAGAEEGLAVWGHRELLDFVEVLSLGFPFYERWYETLNLGFRMAPTAGTDYPCGANLPGRERFYTKLDGPLRYEPWLEAVRRGRTFVTNGPVVDLTVDGVAVGGDLRLSSAGPVHVRGVVRFDPERDDVKRLELIQGGAVVRAVEASPASAEISLDTTLAVEQTSWLALRAVGWKRDETATDVADLFRSMLVLERGSNAALIGGLPPGPAKRPSAAHTGAVYVTVDGTPPLEQQPASVAAARKWLARLDELEARFGEDRISELAGFPGRGDGIGETELRANREAVLRSIEAARRYYSAVAAR